MAPRRRRRHQDAEIVTLKNSHKVGCGRDGFVLKVPDDVLCQKLPPELAKQLMGWGGVVIKVPKFRLKDCTHHYRSAVYAHMRRLYPNDAEATDACYDALHKNLLLERGVQQDLYTRMVTTHFGAIGIHNPCDWWGGNNMPEDIIVALDGIEDADSPAPVRAQIPLDQCLVMPLAIADANDILHPDQNPRVLRAFILDVLVQINLLETHHLAHGDFKLGNIILVSYSSTGRPEDAIYYFLLSDFWDVLSAFGPEEFEAVAMKYLVEWKLNTEKFGTRYYKDPSLLDYIRDSRHHRYQGFQYKFVDRANMWALGLVLSLLILDISPSDTERVRNVIRHDILYSSRSGPQPRPILRADVACARIQGLVTDLSRDSRSRRQRNRKLTSEAGFCAELLELIISEVLVVADKRISAGSFAESLGIDLMNSRGRSPGHQEMWYGKRQMSDIVKSRDR